MDLLTTVRKEGSRGGRGDFKWSDVQSSSHRENYLGHSLMAPVGRWQRGRDLNWYAKGGTNEDSGETLAEKAARERKEEIQRVKEAEQDALARALGYDVPPRNPNMEALGDRKEVDKIVKEAVQDEDTEIGKGIGFGKLGTMQGSSEERIEGNNDDTPDGGIRSLRKDRKEKRRDRSRDRRHRGRSRSRDRDRHHRRRDRHEDDDKRGERSWSWERTRRRRSRSRDRSYYRRGDRDWREDRRNRSRSPYSKDRDSRRNDYHDSRR